MSKIITSTTLNAGERSQAAAISSEEIKLIVEQHLTLWNEQDAAKRKHILSKIYASDIEMIDSFFVATGHQQIEEFIKDLHQKNPDSRFSHLKPVDIHHNVARLFWQSGPKSKPDAVTGMDLFVIENGRVAKMYVFVDGPN